MSSHTQFRNKQYERTHTYIQSRVNLALSQDATKTLIRPLPTRIRRRRELTQYFTLPQVLHFSIDQIPQALEVQAPLSTRSHEQVAPDSGRGDRIVNTELHRSMQADHLLHEMVRAWVHSVGPCDADGEPPAQGLQGRQLPL
jgi:hypothetical protein